MTGETTPIPPYTPDDITASYQLRYTWTGWPTSGARLPDEPDASFFDHIGALWAKDGFRLLERWWSADQASILVSAQPDVAPQRIAQRAKGRLQYELREAEMPTTFSRSFCVQSVGSTCRDRVDNYVASQVDNEEFVDPRFARRMEAFTVEDRQVDLSAPVHTRRGRYLYALHLVLVTCDRSRFTSRERLGRMRDLALAVARKKEHRLSRLSVMPDHMHLSIGAPPSQSPQDVALAYMNNLAHGLGLSRPWQPSYYVGSFGDYDMGALWQNL